MKQLFKWVGLVFVAGVVGLTLGVAYAAGAPAQSLPGGVPGPVAQGTPLPPYSPYGYGPGMMGGGGPGSCGGGMMGGGMRGRGMMGGGMMGGGMMGGRGAWGYPGAGTPLTLDQATDAVRRYLAACGNPDLALVEVIEFSNNFYAEVEEQSTGVHAFELLVDRYSGSVYPEPGPNMMWNARYGHMGNWQSQPEGAMPVTAQQARTDAQQWLDLYQPGTSLADDADAFYGYYTIHVTKDGRIYGMLSVNGYTGAVWYHTWHGTFVGMKGMER